MADPDNWQSRLTRGYYQASEALKLSPQEQYLYMHHLNNLATGRAVKNADGSISTVLQRVVGGPNGRYYNIPSVWNGRILGAKEATMMSSQMGWGRWPSYSSPDEADARYMAMHKYMNDDVSGQ